MERRQDLAEDLDIYLYGPSDARRWLDACLTVHPADWAAHRVETWRAWSDLPPEERPIAPWCAIEMDFHREAQLRTIAEAEAYRELAGPGFGAFEPRHPYVVALPNYGPPPKGPGRWWHYLRNDCPGHLDRNERCGT